MPSQGFLASVSTIHDNIENIRFFISENRKAGIDHFFIFLETQDKEVINYLDDLEFVSIIPSYKLDVKFKALNPRQRFNATFINEFLSSRYSCDVWLTHIDGDEVIYIDKELLFKQEKNIKQVNLQPAESIITENYNNKYTEGLFKGKLTEQQLNLCFALQFINKPELKKWLRGYINHKYIARVRKGIRFDIHNTKHNKNSQKVIDNFFIKHYESTDENEFLRKWLTKRNNSAGNTGVRLERCILRDSIDVICSLEINKEQKEKHLKKIYSTFFYEKNIEDKKELNLYVNLPQKVNQCHNIYINFSDDELIESYNKKTQTSINQKIKTLLLGKKW